ncbi:MAG: hypothetical protein ACKPGI_02125 [Verrucomicrobiota bacterium]
MKRRHGTTGPPLADSGISTTGGLSAPTRCTGTVLPILASLILIAFPMDAGNASGDGSVRTLAGTGGKGRSGDAGSATLARLDNPFGVTRGPDGALYVVEFDGNVVRRIGSDGVITTVAGSGKKGGLGDGGPALEAQFDQPHEIRFGPDGSMYLADMSNHRIRRVDSRSGIVTTVAGTGHPGFSGDGEAATRAALHNPISIQFDAAGNLFICDIGNHRVRRVDALSGRIETFAGSGKGGTTDDGTPYSTAPFNGPRTLDFDAEGNLWLALREANQVWKLDRRTGKALHVAGTGAKGMTGNGGPARLATLSGPKGIAVGPEGRVFVADTENHVIRVIDPASGRIEGLVGDGIRGDGPEGPARGCRLARPHGVFADRNGNLYVGDSENHRVREVHPVAKSDSSTAPFDRPDARIREAQSPSK